MGTWNFLFPFHFAAALIQSCEGRREVHLQVLQWIFTIRGNVTRSFLFLLQQSPTFILHKRNMSYEQVMLMRRSCVGRQFTYPQLFYLYQPLHRSPSHTSVTETVFRRWLSSQRGKGNERRVCYANPDLLNVLNKWSTKRPQCYVN